MPNPANPSLLAEITGTVCFKYTSRKQVGGSSGAKCLRTQSGGAGGGGRILVELVQNNAPLYDDVIKWQLSPSIRMMHFGGTSGNCTHGGSGTTITRYTTRTNKPTAALLGGAVAHQHT